MERQAHLVTIGVVFLGMAGFCYCQLNFELGNIHAYRPATILAIINNIRDTISTILPNEYYSVGQTATGYVVAEGVVLTVRLWIYNHGYQFCSANPSVALIRGDRLQADLIGVLQSYQGEMVRFAASHFLAIQGEYALQYFVDGEAAPPQRPPADSLLPTQLPGHERIDGPPDPSSCWTLFKSTIVGGPEAVQHSTLYARQIIQSSHYYLTMQADCNVVIYRGTQAFWSSGTAGRAAGCRLRLQADGNLLILSSSNDVVWATNVYCIPQPSCQITTIFTIQDDGNAVDHRVALWATNTMQHQ